MAKPGLASQPARKRTRKRKRRLASSSSSSPSSSSASGSSDGEATLPTKQPAAKPPPPLSSHSPSSASSSSSDLESDGGNYAQRQRSSKAEKTIQEPISHQEPSSAPAQINVRRSPSTTPPPIPIPSFLPSKKSSGGGGGGAVDAEEEEQVLKERFRRFWMASVADEFREDLEQIHKEPGLTTSRLAMLVDSLASGADVFSSSATPRSNGFNEMEIVLDS